MFLQYKFVECIDGMSGLLLLLLLLMMMMMHPENFGIFPLSLSLLGGLGLSSSNAGCGAGSGLCISLAAHSIFSGQPHIPNNIVSAKKTDLSAY